MKEIQKTNKQTAEHIRLYIASWPHGMFSWPTDGLGYNQHVRFVQHRNENWKGGSDDDFKQFLNLYADKIEKEPDTLAQCIHPNVELKHYCYCCQEPACKFHGVDLLRAEEEVK